MSWKAGRSEMESGRRYAYGRDHQRQAGDHRRNGTEEAGQRSQDRNEPARSGEAGSEAATKWSSENDQVRCCASRSAAHKTVPMHEHMLNRVVVYMTDQNFRVTIAGRQGRDPATQGGRRQLGPARQTQRRESERQAVRSVGRGIQRVESLLTADGSLDQAARPSL